MRLGPTPLANAFPASPDEFARETRFPLDVFFCESCGLVQLMDVIDPRTLFETYIYVTGTSETVARHNVASARELVTDLGLGGGDLVVEIASNDGSLLKCFRAEGVRTLGVEPAKNIAEIAESEGVETINRFFDAELAREIRDEHGRPAVIVANNVLAHVDHVRDFLRGCADLIADDGHVVMEVPWLLNLVQGLEYDTIYHEHLCYFSIGALVRLFSDAGLTIYDVRQLSIHGGSVRVLATPTPGSRRATRVDALLSQERASGLDRLETFEDFAKRVEASRFRTIGLLEDLVGEGRTVAGYGAPAKGNTLLNYCGIDSTLMPFTVDMNPLKVGRYTPGTHIPICPVSAIEETSPDYLFLLAWNFAKEIIRQQSRFRESGGRFIVPVPKAEVLA